MNKFKTSILIFAVMLMTASCSDDFTVIAPKSDRNVDNFYRTEVDFMTAINGVYATLADRDAYGRNYSLLLEMRSDNTSNGGGNTGLAETLYFLDNFLEISTASEIASTWAGGYKGIAQANTILGRLENRELSDPNLKSRIRGEALFIRSLLYYNLAVIFGNIPLQLDEVTGTEVTVNQVSAGAIYDQIAQDLTEAESLLPASYSEAENIGRATSGAAATLLGLVHLTNGDSDAAEEALRRVVNSGQYDLVENYSDIWGPSNENNIESIFEIQYKSGGTGTGSSYVEFYTPFGESGGVGGGNAPQVITDDVLSIYEEGDERFWGGTFDSTDTGDMYVTKYQTPPFDAFDGDDNFKVFRYADVLLMLAESIGESPEAYDLMNKIRARAGLTTPAEDLPGTFMEKLLLERRREFAIEFKRWPDLLRFGVAKPIMAEQIEGVSESDVRLLYPIPQRELDNAPDELEQNPL